MARLAFPVLLLVAVAAFWVGGFLIWTSYGELEAVERPVPESFSPELVARGAELAAIGNCGVCHTEQGGAPFAGGRAMPTPFGTIHATNITPDEATGIGNWSPAAFGRSMRDGVDREGRHLYPAFPYDHFTLVTDADNEALYAYLMTRPPVVEETPANDLTFPFNLRPLIAGWKLLFFDRGAFEPVAGESEEWNRGFYLAEGLAHCGACHTPRNFLGAERSDRHFEGAEIEAWYAYSIGSQSPAPTPWTEEAMAFYLANGWHERHGVSRGPMAPVTSNLATVPPADIDALATYVVAQMPGGGAEPAETATMPVRATPSADSQQVPADGDGEEGAAIYAAACGICHDAGRPLPYGGIDLSHSSAMNGENPQNVINVTLHGLPAAEGESSPVMPGFAGALDEDELVALIDYMRARFSDQPAWADTRERVEGNLSGETRPTLYRSHGAGGAPANLGKGGVSW